MGDMNHSPSSYTRLGFIKESFTSGVLCRVPDVPEYMYSEFEGGGGLERVNEFLMKNGPIGAEVTYQRAYVSMRPSRDGGRIPNPDQFCRVDVIVEVWIQTL